jgi:fatty-acyl-CoA synthase
MGESGEIVTYRQLDERSNQGAQLFRSLGLRSGDHIALMMENNARFIEIIWAAQRAGLLFTPISTHLPKDDAAYVLGNCGARLFIGSLPQAEIAEQVLCEPSAVEHFYIVGGSRPGFRPWEEALADQPDIPVADQSNGVPMLYSSGTTGRPKGVFVPPANTNVDTPAALVPFLAAAFEFNESSIYLSPAPLFHAGPLHYSMMTTYQGGTVILMEKFEAENALRLIERYRVTHSQWVPIMFIRMLQLPAALRESYDLRSMQLAVHASAPCPIPVKELMIDWWGEILVEYYSASEGIGVTMIGSEDWLNHKGSVGKSSVGELHILGDDDEELPRREVGRVFFGGDHVRFNYHREPDKTAGAYDDRGWATTGDLGYLDEEGFLYLTGRESFTIECRGEKVYPQEMENILVSHSKIADVAVFGIPSVEHGEEIKVVIQPRNWSDATDQTAAEIMTWLELEQRIAFNSMPHSIDFHPNLPRMDNGKLYKRHLFAEYREQALQPAPRTG